MILFVFNLTRPSCFRAQNYVRANNCIQETRRFKSPEGLIQEAKLLGKRGDMDRGIAVLQDCIKQYFSKKLIRQWKNQPDSERCTQHQITCSKAMLLLARFNDEKCNVDVEVNIQNYKDATLIYSQSEKNYFHLANYYDNISAAVEKPHRRGWVRRVYIRISRERYEDLLIIIMPGRLITYSDIFMCCSELQTYVVTNYCRSLLYGGKHIHQSLPRLLFIWFDHATNKPEDGNVNKAGRTHDGHALSVSAMFNMTVKEQTRQISKIEIHDQSILLFVFGQYLT